MACALHLFLHLESVKNCNVVAVAATVANAGDVVAASLGGTNVSHMFLMKCVSIAGRSGGFHTVESAIECC